MCFANNFTNFVKWYDHKLRTHESVFLSHVEPPPEEQDARRPSPSSLPMCSRRSMSRAPSAVDCGRCRGDDYRVPVKGDPWPGPREPGYAQQHWILTVRKPDRHVAALLRGAYLHQGMHYGRSGCRICRDSQLQLQGQMKDLPCIHYRRTHVKDRKPQREV